jgi:hypothetical protein
MGAMMGYVLDQLRQLQPKLNLNTSTLVGFSLGAHTIAYAANWLARNQTITLPMLLALDPAGPLFETASIEKRLDPSDARFVQAIHTNGLSLNEGGYGTQTAMGHVDFMVNGAKSQPGCSRLKNAAHSCSHGRAYALFVDSMYYTSRQTCGWPVGVPAWRAPFIHSHLVARIHVQRRHRLAVGQVFQHSTTVSHNRL